MFLAFPIMAIYAETIAKPRHIIIFLVGHNVKTYKLEST